MICQALWFPAHLWRWARSARGMVLAGVLFGNTASACPPDFSLEADNTRQGVAAFSNATGLWGKHENWAERNQTLFMVAQYGSHSDEYGHGILGALRDAKTLSIVIKSDPESDISTCPLGVHPPEHHVFEGVAPVLSDVTGDGVPEVIVTESSFSKGARVAVYNRDGKRLATTPYIGKRFRWLALIGAADLDGDGRTEIAYIDRPHLAKTLRIWRLDRHKGAPRLTEIASKPGLTNHRIGDDFITSGIRECGAGPEIITVDAGWQTIMATRLSGNTLTSTKVAPFKGQPSITNALSCEN